MTITETRYKVIFTGKTLPGQQTGEVKKNLAASFKLSPDMIERYFVGKPVIVKNNIDLQTAEKYKTLFEKAGAECIIKSLELGTPQAGGQPGNYNKETEKPTATPAGKVAEQNSSTGMQDAYTADEAEKEEQKEENKATPSPPSGTPRVISPPQKPVSLQYTPLQCRALTGAEIGLNFNRYGSENIAFSDILLVSVYNLPAGLKQKTRLMTFIRSQKKPLLVDAETISFADLIRQEDVDIYVSLRRFIADLSITNPALIIDSGTNAFLQGNVPETVKRDDEFRASALGAALDAEGLFVLAAASNLKKPKKTIASMEAEGTDQQIKQNIPKFSEEDYLDLFIGPNADKYRSNFEKFGKGSSAQFTPTWHWPAFFVPFFWLLYRKLYLHAVGLLFLCLIPVVNILASIGMGLSGYYIYFKHVRDSIDALKRVSGPEDIAYNLELEGGVKSLPVYIAAGVLIFVAFTGIMAGIIVPNFIGKKQEKVMEIMNSAPMFPPAMSNAPGMPALPQTTEHAMQMAYDNMAMAELKSACTSAIVFLEQEGSGQLSMEALEQFGYRMKPDVRVSIANADRNNLRMAARHTQGGRTFYADKDCLIK